MKILMTILSSLFLIAPTAFAGPSVSGGVPPHPALTTMSLVAPEAGIDYPTDAPTRITKVLLLYGDLRVPIADTIPSLEKAQAGIDFPTDMVPPFWASIQKVLVLSPVVRVPVRVGLSGADLVWMLPSGQSVVVAQIAGIEKAQAGIDDPTDAPARNSFVMVMKDGTRIGL